MSPNHFFGIAAIIASTALLFSSFKTASAYPNGPNVSLGSNPIEAAQIDCNSQEQTLFANGNDAFIITDLIVSDGYSTGGVDLKLNGNTWMAFGENVVIAFESGIPIPPNATISCTTYYGRSVTITGYYAHP